jgi:type VI secretion system ImpC/EvpB family protein/type VI secretion system ImpB/VipA family protein
MQYTLNLGQLNASQKPRAATGKDVLRLAVLGDFSGRASGGQLAIGAELAKRKPLTVDVDNLDAVIGRFSVKLTLPIGAGGGAVEIPIQSIDDFHPDQLYDNVEIFSSLSGLRQRLKTTSTFAKAAAEVQSWLGEPGADADSSTTPPASNQPRASSIPTSGQLSDFAQLMGKPTAQQADTPVGELLKRIVGPHIVPAKDPKQDKLLAAVDQAISQSMRSILHQPDFQALESAWRSVEFLVRRLETSATLRIVLYDISAEELAADLSSTEKLDETGLYALLVEQPAADAQQGAISATVTTYFFEATPSHADLLGRLARIAAAGQFSFLSAIGVDVLNKRKPEELDPAVVESWGALKSMPEAGYVGLATPRFMLRNPYGSKTDPIDRFDFEEYTKDEGPCGILFASGAVLAGLLVGETFTKQGLKKMNLGSIMSAGEMPYFVHEDDDGDQVAFPCTERLLTIDQAAHVSSQGFMPVLAIKGKPEVRLGSFQSLTARSLAGPWAPVTLTSSQAPAPAAATQAAPAAVAAAPTTEVAPSPEPAAETARPPAAESETPAPQPTAESIDADLDALLSSLDPPGEATPAATGQVEPELDADLAALLADL